jgi:hypothetical protein
MVVILFLLVGLTPLLPGQTKSLERIARDQQNIRYRLEQIQKKMERLVKKNELEGRQHTANLIRQAEAEIQNRNVLKRIEDLDTRIRAAQLTVDEEQSALLKDLEDIFAILQDRSDLERIEDILQAYVTGLERITQLIGEQDRILEETRRLVYDEDALLSSTSKKLEEITAREEDLKHRVEGAARKGAPDEAWWSLTDSLDNLAEEEEELAEQTEERSLDAGSEGADLAEDQQDLAEKLETIRERIKNQAKGAGSDGTMRPKMEESLRSADATTAQVKENMEKASEDLKSGRFPNALEKERQAAEGLREASEALREAGRAAFQDKRFEEMGLADLQEGLREQMNRVAGQLERLQSLGEDTPGEEQDSLEKAQEIVSAMEAARNALQEGRAGDAKPHIGEALGGLKELSKQLKNQKSAGSTSPNAQDAAQRSQTYQELAKRQKELERKTRELIRRLRELPEEGPMEELSNAADNMAGASEELGAERGEDAETEEEEAKKYLERALKELVQEETKYQNIRQQEVLFRVQQALEDLKKRQDEINDKTVAFDLERGESRRLNRLQRKNLSALSQGESEIRAETGEIKERLEEDDATIFSWVLERNAEDLQEVVDMLQRKETGPLVHAVQKDISQRFGELIDAMKLELDRRRNAESDPNMANQPPQRNPLIPPVAELIMVKKMEESALRRLEEFLRLHPEIKDQGVGPMEARMLERLGHRHTSITELFTKMLQRNKERAEGVEPEGGR